MQDERLAGRPVGRARGRAAPMSEDFERSSPRRGDSPELSTGARARGGLISMRTRPEGMGANDHIAEGGREVSVFANYFHLNTSTSQVCQDYQVFFDPPKESFRVRRKLIEHHKDLFGGAYIFDGGANLKSLNELPDKETVLETTVTIPADEGVKTETCTVTFRHVGVVPWGSQEMLRMYNTQMRRNLRHLGWMQIYRDFYNPNVNIEFPAYKMKIMCGLSTAINQYDAGIMMVCDSINKVIRQETAYDILKEVRGRGAQTFKDNARKELCGAIVLTAYNNKSYRIDDIDFTKNCEHRFERRGVMTSLVEYYKDQHSISIRDPRQPLIVCLPSTRDKRFAEQQGREASPILLVPELCLMTGMSESMRSDMELKKIMTQQTQFIPQQKYNNLIAFKNQLRDNETVREEMTKWQLSFDASLLSIKARVLPGEKILMHGMQGKEGGIPFNSQAGDFSKEIRESSMFDPRNLENWVIIHSQRDESSARDFAQTCYRVGIPLGMTIERPHLICTQSDSASSFVQGLRTSQAVQANFVVCIVPNDNKDRYDAIKKICCIDHPKPSQVIKSRTLQKKQMLMSVCTKVTIQMASKIGGQPWALHIPAPRIMVIGYDTYHDGLLRDKSVGGFVATINNEMTSYFSKVAYHSNRDEMSMNFASHIEDAMKAYQNKNQGIPPTRVVIYRDGVGDGMLQHVYEVEVKAINEAIEKVFGRGSETKVCFIVVSKRISTRFFLKKIVGQQKLLENPPPGTVVDRDCTRPDRWEFYLISQSVRKGTVSPTCYNVLHNTTNFKANHVQTLSYKMCHLYYNWMGMIRVPAVCQYAHKLAYLTGTSLHAPFNANLSQQLFYL